MEKKLNPVSVPPVTTKPNLSPAVSATQKAPKQQFNRGAMNRKPQNVRPRGRG